MPTGRDLGECNAHPTPQSCLLHSRWENVLEDAGDAGEAGEVRD